MWAWSSGRLQGTAPSYIHVECSRGDRDCLLQRLLRLFNPAELAQRRGEPTVSIGIIGI